MTTNPVSPITPASVPVWKERLQRVLRARSTFIILQVLDLLTTLAAFRVGAFEVNPLVARFTVMFGPMQGVLYSKLIAIVIAMGVRRLLWVVNLFYSGIILWNLLVLFLLAHKIH